MTTKQDVVADLPVFQQLPLDMRERLSKAGTVVENQPKHLYFAQGDKLVGLHALVVGNVKLYRQSTNRTQVLALLRTGDCFGTEVLSHESTSSYCAAGITQTTAFFIPASTMRSLLEEYPEFRMILLQLVTERLHQFASLVHDLAFRDLSSRLATILVRRAEEEGIHTPEGIRIPRLMNQSELATMVGTVREGIQRTFKKFSQARLVDVSQKEIIILDLDRLRQIAERETR